MTGGKPPSPLLIVLISIIISTSLLTHQTCTVLMSACTNAQSLYTDACVWRGVFIVCWALRDALSTLIFQEEELPAQLLLLVQLAAIFVDSRPKAVRVAAEGNVQVLQELVAASQ